jgi:Ras-related protein Rab-11A
LHNEDWTVLTLLSEIYRIVSSKALDAGEGSQNVMSHGGQPLQISKPDGEEGKKGCC